VFASGTTVAVPSRGMELFSQKRPRQRGNSREDSARLRSIDFAFVALICLLTVMESSCAGSTSAPTGPSQIVVTVSPITAIVALNGTQQFQASVTGTSNTRVTWEVNGISNGNSSVGTIEANGSAAAMYTAPPNLPSPATVTVTAVSQADSAVSATAAVTLQGNGATTITVAPNPATVPTGGAQVFTATIAGSATSITWNVNGIAGGNSTVGTVIATGATMALYTAPSAPPSPATVTVTATSTDSNSISGSASVTITCSASNSISPSSATVALDQTQTFTASFCAPSGSNIIWQVNGIVGGNSSVGMIAATSSNAALYTAPSTIPATNPVTVSAVVDGSSADVSASVTINSDVSLSISPTSATLAPAARQTFAAAVTGSSNPAVSWSVNGIPNGNAAVGQVCQSGTNPCVAPTDARSNPIDYLAPAIVPTTNPVTLFATSIAAPSASASAVIAISPTQSNAALTVSPGYVFLAPSSTQQLSATVAGTAANVTWTVESAIAGEGCAGASCGSIDADGLYTAPASAPSPNAISVIATSVANPSLSSSATVTITSGPTIEQILPSSVMAGAVEGFAFSVQGVNFVAGGGNTASSILINSVARSTTCPSATVCTTALNPSDVQTSGTLTIQIQNPGSPGQLSNPVPFIVVPFDVSVDTIALSSSQPIALGKNVIVVEPTTAAESSPINVNSIGLLTGNSCGVQGSPLIVNRPTSGTAAVSLCIQGNGLDSTFSYVFSGPNTDTSGGDIGVTASAITGLFPGMIELDLQISNTTLPGVRSLFITTPNNDRAIATGMLEVD
jgi:hypothetical protein